VSFDPFGDFATEGYLRNVEKEKDLDIVKRLEHTSFTTGLDEAFTALGKSRQFSYSDVLLSYSDVLRTHGILFKVAASLDIAQAHRIAGRNVAGGGQFGAELWGIAANLARPRWSSSAISRAGQRGDRECCRLFDVVRP
jgi:hypothetical protein